MFFFSHKGSLVCVLPGRVKRREIERQRSSYLFQTKACMVFLNSLTSNCMLKVYKVPVSLCIYYNVKSHGTEKVMHIHI